MYFLYVLQSELDESLYIGHSRDVNERLRRHNEGHSRSTKGKRPWKLIYLKSFSSRSEAMQLEYKIKSWKNREYILEWLRKNADG